MADIKIIPLPPAQARTWEMVPIEWADIPRIGVHGLVLRALKDRGIVQTRWREPRASAAQWRRTPPGAA